MARAIGIIGSRGILIGVEYENLFDSFLFGFEYITLI